MMEGEPKPKPGDEVPMDILEMRAAIDAARKKEREVAAQMKQESFERDASVAAGKKKGQMIEIDRAYMDGIIDGYREKIRTSRDSGEREENAGLLQKFYDQRRKRYPDLKDPAEDEFRKNFIEPGEPQHGGGYDVVKVLAEAEKLRAEAARKHDLHEAQAAKPTWKKVVDGTWILDLIKKWRS